jgi:hypothetical protein
VGTLVLSVVMACEPDVSDSAGRSYEIPAADTGSGSGGSLAPGAGGGFVPGAAGAAEASGGGASGEGGDE